FQNYVGGRFEGFSGPGISESNVAGLLIVTGIMTTAALFLSGKLKEKIAAMGMMPFTLNALIATISRSGFLALGIAGVVLNFFAPKKSMFTVRFFSVAGLILLVSLTNPVYWERIGTILAGGEQVEGVDTGSKRLVLMGAQFEMSKAYPLGCGHRCTAVLSPNYLDDAYLTVSPSGVKARASHNTFMTMLVEQGIPGAIFYFMLLLWMARTCLRLRRPMRDREGLIPQTYAAVVAVLAAITVGDLFVDYLKFEARLWFISILMVLVRMNAEMVEAEKLVANERATDCAKFGSRNVSTSRRRASL
ncbi:MAG: O-antigen ligase family protein, partial [Pseudomonadota bacterium]